MRRLTATEAARRFSDVLDQVERAGETFLVERHGRAIASIAPAGVANGRIVKDLLRAQPADPTWPADLAEPYWPSPSGPVLARLLVDTTVLIAVERGTSTIDAVLEDADDVALAAITAAELLVGVHRADEGLVESRRAFVESLLSSVPIEPYDLEVAREHAELLAHTGAAGHPRGAHDLLIAATARARSRTLVSAHASGFDSLPGVTVRLLPTTC